MGSETIEKISRTTKNDMRVRHTLMMMLISEAELAQDNCYSRFLLHGANSLLHSHYANGVNWRTWKGYYYSLKTTEMKIRPT